MDGNGKNVDVVDDIGQIVAERGANLPGRPHLSQAEREFYVQFEPADWQYRRNRYLSALQRDRELGQWINAQWEIYAQACRSLELVVHMYQQQAQRRVDLRLHVRRCRHGCICCPHYRLAFYQDGKELEIPVQVQTLRALGIRRLSSSLRAANKAVLDAENAIREYYRRIEQFADQAVDRLLEMDQQLATLEYPYYPTPTISPQPSALYTPLPYLLSARLADWLDDAQMSLSFALLRYATLFVRTRYMRVKQGFFGIHLQKRQALCAPLYSQIRIYFRGYHGAWFSANKSIHKNKAKNANEVKKEPVRIRRWYLCRTGNRSFFYDVRSYHSMHKQVSLISARHTVSLLKLTQYLRRI